MIINDKKEEFDKQVELTEYLASFWNHEAVKKVREAKAQRDLHAFMDDKEFEENIVSQTYKNHPLLEAIKKIKEMENPESQAETPAKDFRRTKPPTNLSELSRLIKKF